MRGLKRSAAIGMTALMVGGLLPAAIAFATTTPRTIDEITTDWPADDYLQTTRMSANGDLVVFTGPGNVPATRPGASGFLIFGISLGSSLIEQINVDSNENGYASQAFPGGISSDGRYVTYTDYETPGFGHAVGWIRDN